MKGHEERRWTRWTLERRYYADGQLVAVEVVYVTRQAVHKAKQRTDARIRANLRRLARVTVR